MLMYFNVGSYEPLSEEDLLDLKAVALANKKSMSA